MKRNPLLCKTSLTALAFALSSTLLTSNATAKGVTWEDIKNDATTTEDVLMYGMGPKAQRFSPLDQVNKSNVHTLTPAWMMSFGDEKQRA